jgi:aspartate kinase
MKKTKIGGIIQNPRLAALWILGIADRPGIAATVLNALGYERINVQFIVQCIDSLQQDHICLCVDRDDLAAAHVLVKKAADTVGAQWIKQTPAVSIVSIFGPDFRERPAIAGTMFNALAIKDINILAISTSISTVSCVIDENDLAAALESLQQTFDLP